MVETKKRNAVFHVASVGSLPDARLFLSSLSSAYCTGIRLIELPEIYHKSIHEIDLDMAFQKIEILPSEELFISSIKVGSPGFWEFIGNLNPLNFIVEFSKMILDWKMKRENLRLEWARFNYESAESYFDILERYEVLASRYEEKPSAIKRFVRQKTIWILALVPSIYYNLWDLSHILPIPNGISYCTNST